MRKLKGTKITVFLLPVHQACNCIYRKIKRCLKEKVETKENAEEIKKLLKNAGFPKGYGLTENCIIYRWHNDGKIISLMNEWWAILSTISHRDQLLLSFLLWKRSIAVSEITLPNARFDGRNFCFHAHLSKYR